MGGDPSNLIRVMPAKGQGLHTLPLAGRLKRETEAARMRARREATMQRSLFLAQLIGPIFVAIGVGMLINGPLYLAMADAGLHSYVLIYLSGVMTLTAGIALVLTHNVWVGDWRLIITILGWLGVIGGAFRIVWPQAVIEVAGRIIAHAESLMFAGFAVLVVGAVLSYFGYADTAPSKSRARRRRR
jgi:hypothetical protein